MKVVKSNNEVNRYTNNMEQSGGHSKLIFTAVCNQIIAKKHTWPFYTILQYPGERIIFFAVK